MSQEYYLHRYYRCCYTQLLLLPSFASDASRCQQYSTAYTPPTICYTKYVIQHKRQQYTSMPIGTASIGLQTYPTCLRVGTSTYLKRGACSYASKDSDRVLSRDIAPGSVGSPAQSSINFDIIFMLIRQNRPRGVSKSASSPPPSRKAHGSVRLSVAHVAY